MICILTEELSALFNLFTITIVMSFGVFSSWVKLQHLCWILQLSIYRLLIRYWSLRAVTINVEFG